MQAIRRTAQGQSIPSCLVQLKKLEVAYMETFIQTLLALQGKADASVINTGAAQAKQYHNMYALEAARLLGVTVIVPPTPTPGPVSTSTP